MGACSQLYQEIRETRFLPNGEQTCVPGIDVHVLLNVSAVGASEISSSSLGLSAREMFYSQLLK